MENIELKLDENNELIFDVNIAGTDAKNAVPKFRFIFENDKISYGFAGYTRDGNVIVDVPPLKQQLTEGQYPAHLEVLIDDRCFTPLRLDVTFKNALTVTAESVVVKNASSKAPEIISETPSEPSVPTASFIATGSLRENKPVLHTKAPVKIPPSPAKRFLTLKEKFNK